MAVRLEALSHRGQAALPDLRAAAAGRIVTVASTAGVTGYPFVAAYVAAKHAAVGLTRPLAPELAGTPVPLNPVCPGFLETAPVATSVQTNTATPAPHYARARPQTHPSNPKGP